MANEKRLIVRELYHIVEHLDNASRARTIEEAQGDILMAKGMALRALQREKKSRRKEDGNTNGPTNSNRDNVHKP